MTALNACEASMTSDSYSKLCGGRLDSQRSRIAVRLWPLYLDTGGIRVVEYTSRIYCNVQEGGDT